MRSSSVCFTSLAFLFNTQAMWSGSLGPGWGEKREKKRVGGGNLLAFGFEWQWERTQIGIKRIWDELPHSVSKSTVQLFHVFEAESILHSLFIDWILLRRGVGFWVSANFETRFSSSPLLSTIGRKLRKRAKKVIWCKRFRFNNLNGSCWMNDDDVRRAPFKREIVSFGFSSVLNLSHSGR